MASESRPSCRGYPLCSAPWELDRLKLEFSARLSWLGEERDRMKASKFTDERGTVAPVGPRKPEWTEGVHPEAGRSRHAGRGDMSQGGDQPGDLLQLKEEGRRALAG